MGMKSGARRAGQMIEELAVAIEGIEGRPPRTADDAAAVVELLGRHMSVVAIAGGESGIGSLLNPLLTSFQRAETEAAEQALRERGIPLLLETYDRKLAELDAHPAAGEGYDARADELLFILKIFAIYVGRPQTDRIAAAALRPLDPDGFMWSIVLRELASATDCGAVDRLAATELAGFIRIAFLDYANYRARHGLIAAHPFDTYEGRSQLRVWLESRDPDDYSYAHSAAASLPFIDRREAEALAPLTDDHADVAVQMEGAWARAKLGDAAGVARLSQLSSHPSYASRAQAYLTELDRRDAIALEADDPDFRAMAEMAEWLAQPAEFGRAPDELEQIDSREIFWPPTDDTRQVWLFRYRYDDGDEPAEGRGMVGSVTFALVGESTADETPEDIYALHCCWELGMRDDPRAPKTRSVDAGRRLLGWA